MFGCSAHKPEAQAKVGGRSELPLRLRFRLVCRTRNRDLRKEVPLDQLLARSDRSAVRLVDQLADSASGPLSVAHRHELIVRMADALQALPEHYRQVLQLRYLEERPLNEIARELGRTKGATAMLMARAIEKLRELLSVSE